MDEEELNYDYRRSIGENVGEEMDFYEENSEPARPLKKCIRKNSAVCFTDYKVPGKLKKIFQTKIRSEEECSEESCSSSNVESQILSLHPGPQEDIEKCVAFWEKIMQENLEPIKCTLIKGKKQRDKEKEEAIERKEVLELREAVKSVKETEDKLKNIFIKAVSEVQKHKLDKLKVQAKKKCPQCKILSSLDVERGKSCVDFNLGDITGLSDWISPAKSKFPDILNDEKPVNAEQEKEFAERKTLNVDDIVAEKEKGGAYRKWRETDRPTCECNYLPDCICNTYKVISKESICIDSEKEKQDVEEEDQKSELELAKVQGLDYEYFETKHDVTGVVAKQESLAEKKSAAEVGTEDAEHLPDFILDKVLGVADYDFDEDPNLIEAENRRRTRDEEVGESRRSKKEPSDNLLFKSEKEPSDNLLREIKEEKHKETDSLAFQVNDNDGDFYQNYEEKKLSNRDVPPKIDDDNDLAEKEMFIASNDLDSVQIPIDDTEKAPDIPPEKTFQQDTAILLEEQCTCSPKPCNCPKRYLQIEHPILSNTDIPTAPNIQTVSIAAAVSSIELYSHLKIVGIGSSGNITKVIISRTEMNYSSVLSSRTVKSCVIKKANILKACRFCSSKDDKIKSSPLKKLLDDSATFQDLNQPNPEQQWVTLPYPRGTRIRKQGEYFFKPKHDPRDTSIIIFPGQGSQFVGMAKGLMKFPMAKDLFELANYILGYDLLKLCLEGPKDKLDQTKYCQPAVMVTSLAAIERLKEERPQAIENCVGTAGFSLGEITSLVFAGALNFERALKLVQIRGEAMQIASEMNQGHMVTVFYAPDSKVNFACLRAKEWAKDKGDEVPECRIANYLFPHCKVISGSVNAIDYLEKNYKEFNLKKVKRLPVSGAFHSELMRPAVEPFQKALKKSEIQDPVINVYSNVDGKTYKDANHIRHQLPKQIVKPVKWEQLLHTIYERRPDDFFPRTFECGPGTSLKAILKQVNQKAWNTCFRELTDKEKANLKLDHRNTSFYNPITNERIFIEKQVFDNHDMPGLPNNISAKGSLLTHTPSTHLIKYQFLRTIPSQTSLQKENDPNDVLADFVNPKEKVSDMKYNTENNSEAKLTVANVETFKSNMMPDKLPHSLKKIIQKQDPPLDKKFPKHDNLRDTKIVYRSEVDIKKQSSEFILKNPKVTFDEAGAKKCICGYVDCTCFKKREIPPPPAVKSVIRQVEKPAEEPKKIVCFCGHVDCKCTRSEELLKKQLKSGKISTFESYEKNLAQAQRKQSVKSEKSVYSQSETKLERVISNQEKGSQSYEISIERSDPLYDELDQKSHTPKIASGLFTNLGIVSSKYSHVKQEEEKQQMAKIIAERAKKNLDSFRVGVKTNKTIKMEMGKKTAKSLLAQKTTPLRATNTQISKSKTNSFYSDFYKKHDFDEEVLKKKQFKKPESSLSSATTILTLSE
ncbi:unnamed protein product [Brassicogethes aeneus]|uniref:[acyl-carrier-protein] S-malonyltransferase n=1 Tax=Brassicogethes aeneus TaxID=1431903 RepID=A0A9P0FH10_BRAAE|nr:unnamed protein product [Brassicogethes aeneus]